MLIVAVQSSRHLYFQFISALIFTLLAWYLFSFERAGLSFYFIFQVCQTLGLAGIDLFTPSDVVEKRNVRKVCMSIRSLSKKAGMMQLNVSPRFESNLFQQCLSFCKIKTFRSNFHWPINTVVLKQVFLLPGDRCLILML